MYNLMLMATAAPNFSTVTDPIIDLINALVGPAIAIVGALGAIFVIILGVKFAKAEEPQDREKAKSSLKNAIIGFVLIFVLLVALKAVIPIMQQWINDEGGYSVTVNETPGAGSSSST